MWVHFVHVFYVRAVCVLRVCVFWVMMRRGRRTNIVIWARICQPMLSSAEKILIILYNTKISQEVIE